MKKSNKQKIGDAINLIITTAIGGVLLLVASFFVNAFFSSPPSRADFDSFKTKVETQNISIDRRLEKLDRGQEKIIDIIISKEK